MQQKFAASLLIILLSACTLYAQTTAFTYQGKLTDTGNPANGSYDLQFKLFDTATVGTGTQQGATFANPTVAVSNGVFTVTLDFGANVFTGAARWLEIGVRPTGSMNAYTVLAPRQPVTSTPYAIQTLHAASADALTSACAGCVTSTNIGSVNGSAVTGTIPVASVPAGSANYIQNTTGQQASSNFNISGNGLIGGTLGVGLTPSAATLSAVNHGFNTPALFQWGGTVGRSVGTVLALTNDNTGTISFIEGSDPITSPVFRIAGNGDILTMGKVGVGTYLPADKLMVQTATNNYGVTHTDGAITVGSFVGGLGGWYGTKSNHPLFFFTNNGNAQITLTTAGDVGIGLVAPSRKLDVAGRARVESIPLEASAASLCFNSFGDLLQCGASSLRWKKNVQPFRNGLDVVMRLRPIRFNWKEDNRADIGLGAEDVAKIAPSLTFTDKAGEISGVRYEKLNLLLINAVQQQQAQIKQQQAQIKGLQKQLLQLQRLTCRQQPQSKVCQPTEKNK